MIWITFLRAILTATLQIIISSVLVAGEIPEFACDCSTVANPLLSAPGKEATVGPIIFDLFTHRRSLLFKYSLKLAAIKQGSSWISLLEKEAKLNCNFTYTKSTHYFSHPQCNGLYALDKVYRVDVKVGTGGQGNHVTLFIVLDVYDSAKYKIELGPLNSTVSCPIGQDLEFIITDDVSLPHTSTKIIVTISVAATLSIFIVSMLVLCVSIRNCQKDRRKDTIPPRKTLACMDLKLSPQEPHKIESFKDVVLWVTYRRRLEKYKKLVKYWRSETVLELLNRRFYSHHRLSSVRGSGRHWQIIRTAVLGPQQQSPSCVSLPVLPSSDI